MQQLLLLVWRRLPFGSTGAWAVKDGWLCPSASVVHAGPREPSPAILRSLNDHSPWVLLSCILYPSRPTTFPLLYAQILPLHHLRLPSQFLHPVYTSLLQSSSTSIQPPALNLKDTTTSSSASTPNITMGLITALRSFKKKLRKITKSWKTPVPPSYNLYEDQCVETSNLRYTTANCDPVVSLLETLSCWVHHTTYRPPRRSSKPAMPKSRAHQPEPTRKPKRPDGILRPMTLQKKRN